MLRNALGVIRRDPETLLFTLASMALLLTPLALVIAAGLAAEPQAAPRGPLAAAMAPALELLRFSARWRLGQAFGYACIIAAAFLSFLVGGLMTCAILACAIKRLRGEDPTAADGLSAMWRTAPRMLGFALGAGQDMNGRGGSELVSPAVSLSLAIMVDQDVDYPEALRRARALEDADTLQLGRIDKGATTWLWAVFIAGWLYGMYAAAGRETTVGVMGAMFGIPLALAIVFGSLLATLQTVVLAALYMRALHHEKGIQSYVDVFFPPGA